jgi:hypothetical protein
MGTRMEGGLMLEKFLGNNSKPHFGRDQVGIIKLSN